MFFKVTAAQICIRDKHKHKVLNQSVNRFTKQARFRLQPGSRSISLRSNSVNSASCVTRVSCCINDTDTQLDILSRETLAKKSSLSKRTYSFSPSRETSVSSLEARLSSLETRIASRETRLSSLETRIASRKRVVTYF